MRSETGEILERCSGREKMSESERKREAGNPEAREEEERVQLKLWDNFSKLHEIEALSIEALCDRIYELDAEELIRKAYEASIKDFAEGRVMIDIRTGELETGCYIGNTEDIFQPYIVLYSIPENLDFPYEDLLDDEECRKLREEYEGDFKDMVEKEEIDVEERFVEALSTYDDAPFRNEWWEGINAQMDELYEQIEDEE